MKKPTAIPPAATTLSDDQMQDLAQSFHDIAVEIGQVRLNAIAAGSKLTDPAIVQLQGYVYSLMNIAASFAMQAANITLANVDQAVNQISLATKAADQALDKLQSIDKAVNIASSVIVLAMAISTKDPGQIESAARSVANAAGLGV
jgi:alkylhydroperoxidase/carboxymuconolactone decarboxylase family protein YurZ